MPAVPRFEHLEISEEGKLHALSAGTACWGRWEWDRHPSMVVRTGLGLVKEVWPVFLPHLPPSVAPRIYLCTCLWMHLYVRSVCTYINMYCAPCTLAPRVGGELSGQSSTFGFWLQTPRLRQRFIVLTYFSSTTTSRVGRAGYSQNTNRCEHAKWRR